MDTNAHAHAIERARAYLERLPPDMEAAAVIRALFDGLDYEQETVKALSERVAFLERLLTQIETTSTEAAVVALARKRDDHPHGAWA